MNVSHKDHAREGALIQWVHTNVSVTLDFGRKMAYALTLMNVSLRMVAAVTFASTFKEAINAFVQWVMNYKSECSI